MSMGYRWCLLGFLFLAAAAEEAERCMHDSCQAEGSEEMSALQLRSKSSVNMAQTVQDPEDGDGLEGYKQMWQSMRRGLTPEEEAEVAKGLEERYQEVTPEEEAEVVYIPFKKHGYNSNYDIYTTMKFEGASGGFTQHMLIDTGFNSIQMCCSSDLDLTTKYTVVQNDAVSPFNGWLPALIVRGDVSFKLSPNVYYTVQNVSFYACTCAAQEYHCRSRCQYHGVGLGVVEQFSSGLYAPLSPKGGAIQLQPRYLITFDYQKELMVLFSSRWQAPQCENKWLSVSHVNFTSLKVTELRFRDQSFPDWVSPTTEAFFDTGGGQTYLSWENSGGANPFPPSLGNPACPGDSFFSSPSPSQGYSGCVCHYAPEVVFELQGRQGNFINATFTQSAVHTISNSPSVYETPTLVTCATANVGDKNWVNLGGVLFFLNKISFDYETQQVCMVEYPVPEQGRR